MNVATLHAPTVVADEHSFGTWGLTRDQSGALLAMVELLQPRFRFTWKLVPHERAQVVFVPLALADSAQTRLHRDQISVVVCTEGHHCSGKAHEVELPFRVAPMLELMHGIEHGYTARSREVFRPADQDGPELLCLLRQWLRGKHPGGWHVTRLHSGETVWLRHDTLQYSVSDDLAARLDHPIRGWSMPLPTIEHLPQGGVPRPLAPLVWQLASAPTANRPDWMFEDHAEVHLTSWPDLGQLGASHWQIQVAAILSNEYLTVSDLAHRLGRSVHDVAGFVSACDVFGHVSHRAPVTQLHERAHLRAGQPIAAAEGQPARETGGFFGLLRAIRDRLQGKSA